LIPNDAKSYSPQPTSWIRRRAGFLLGLGTVRNTLSGQHGISIPNLASNSFIFLLFEPKVLRRSGYSHSCRNLVQVPHFGLIRSHFSLRFRHETHEIVFSGALPSAVGDA
jgi:hypothetical protein